MKRSRLGSLAIASSAVVAAAMAVPAMAATTSGEVPTYQEFKASTFQDVDRQYIVNGDEPVSDNH
ncbi:MAG: hypothetical protein LT071_08010, partial [Nocardioides sp.]|nr:hypothetical protein [Nocardioides sp.]